MRTSKLNARNTRNMRTSCWQPDFGKDSYEFQIRAVYYYHSSMIKTLQFSTNYRIEKLLPKILKKRLKNANMGYMQKFFGRTDKNALSY